MIENQFFTIESKITDIISVLLSISLYDQFNEQTLLDSIFTLKLKNSEILGKLLSQNRSNMKNDCANILLKSLLEGD